jgi:hypothetical protein
LVSIENHRRRHARQAQRANEGDGLPMSMRHAGSQALATERTAANSGHFGAGGRLVQENEGRRIKIDLAFKPELSRF